MTKRNLEEQQLDPLARLKPNDRKLWVEYLNNGFVKIDAFVKINKKAAAGVASGFNKHKYKTSCTFAFNKIKAVMTQEELLEAHGLGKDRVMTELDSRLNANTDKYFQTTKVATLQDNGTRMKATELLSRIHGMDKQVIVDDSKAKVEIYLPENKRDSEEVIKPPSITLPSGATDDIIKMFEEANPGVKVILEDSADEE